MNKYVSQIRFSFFIEKNYSPLCLRKSTKKAMKLSNQRMELIKELNIRALFVTEMLEFYLAATNAKILGINAPDPVIFKDEARKYAKMFGDCFIHDYNTFLNNYGL